MEPGERGSVVYNNCLLDKVWLACVEDVFVETKRTSPRVLGTFIVDG